MTTSAFGKRARSKISLELIARSPTGNIAGTGQAPVDDDPLGTVANAADLDLVGADDARPPADQLDAGARQELAVDGIEAADLGAPVRLQRLPVEARGADAPAEAVRFLEAFGVVGGEAVQLLRDAADVDAGAAERRIFRDRDLDAALRGQTRGPHPAAAGTDDEE